MDTTKTPTELGFHMPAEWEPQEAVWLSWPHNRETWPGAFGPVPAVFAEIARHIAEGQLVRINVRDEQMKSEVNTLLNSSGVRIANVRFHLNPTNDCWVRDYGPIYVVQDNAGACQRAITNWGYNAWGEKYPPFDLDNAVPARIAAEFDELCCSGGMILEGGSIDVNGQGTLLTTESCLLNPNRNPELSRDQIESRLKEYLGITKILWLGEGIVGDDTDGHIDDLARFVGPHTVVIAIEDHPSDPNYRPLLENHQRLRGLTNESGRPLHVVTLPMPDPVYFGENRLPASYANFLIVNEKVLVPTYRCGKDQTALGILQSLFPDRNVVGIDCTDLAWGLGAIHCVTQQQPAVHP
jgi:agmatine deiminase